MAAVPNDLPFQAAALVLFLAHSALVGVALTRVLGTWEETPGPDGHTYLRWFFALSAGLLADIALLFALGAAGSLTPAGVLAAGVAAAGGAAVILAPALPARLPGWRPLSAALPDAVNVALLFAIVAIAAVRPPGHWDDTAYHLPLARFYVERGSLALHEFVRFPLFPQNMDLLFALGLMLGGDVLAQAMAALPLFVMGIGLLGASAWVLGSQVPGFLAVLVLLEIGPVRMTRGYAYVDDGLGLFCWGALLAVAVWRAGGRRSRGWIVLAGMLAGGAAGTKLFGLPFAALLGLYLLAVRRDWRAAAVYAGALLAFGSWWYIRSALISGDPIHPAGGPWFGYFLWNADDLVHQRAELATFGVGRNPLNLWPALVEARVTLWAPAFLSMLFLLRKYDRRLLVLPGAFLAYFAFWFFVVQVERYLAPVYAVAGFLSVLVVHRAAFRPLAGLVASRVPRLRHRLAPALLCGVPLTYFLVADGLAASRRLAVWGGSLSERPAYALFQEANGLMSAAGPRLVQVGFESGVYFFKGTTIGDWFGPGRYARLLDCDRNPCRLKPPADVSAVMAGFDSRMLAVNTSRFEVDVSAYLDRFELRRRTDHGVLLVLK